MALFSFLKQPQKKIPEAKSSILGMILLAENHALDMEAVVGALENKWALKIASKATGEEASVLHIDGYQIAIASVPMPIPGEEIQETAAYNYFWENGPEEATKHKGHIILSIQQAGKNPIKENMLFNQVASSILEHSQSIGIYMGSRTLLLKKDFYLANTAGISAEHLPLYNWIYFGVRQENEGLSIYTYGLRDFGKEEMEIINSKKPFEELNGMMYNLAHYVLASNVTLKDGATIGISAEQKLKITASKGQFLEGMTLKIAY